MQKKWLLICLGILILFTAKPILVFSANETTDDLNKQIQEKKSKIKELEESIAAYKKKIDQTKLQAVSFKNQIVIINSNVAKVELDVRSTEVKMDELSLEIESLGASIGDKQINIDRQKKLIGNLLRTLQQGNGQSFLEILVAYDNFSSFYNRLQHVEDVERDLGQSAKALRVDKEALEDKKTSKEELKKKYSELKDKLKDQKQDLSEQLDFKQELLTKTKASEATYSVLLDNLRKQYQAIESEVTSIEREVRRRLDEQNKLKRLSSESKGKVQWPVQSRYVTAYFHDPDYPYRHVFEHNAIDLRLSQGTAVKAAASGYVARAKKCASSSCYSYVMIIHADGLATVYGHLSSITATEDKFINVGDILGYSGGRPGSVGAGPFVTGPHLHFEVRVNGIPVNPLDYLVP